MALGEKCGESGLGGGAKREISIGDDFETFKGGTDLRGGAGDGEPGYFHLREGGDFGEAAEGEGEGFGVSDEGFA